MTLRRFELHRDTDISGVSGTGVVAEGVAFTDGVVALRWKTEWPTSVVFHDRGVESVQAIHGHSGATRIVWLDMLNSPPEPAMSYADMWTELTGYVQAAVENPQADDAKDILNVMGHLKAQRLAPVADWMRNIPAASSSPDTPKEPTHDHSI